MTLADFPGVMFAGAQILSGWRTMLEMIRKQRWPMHLPFGQTEEGLHGRALPLGYGRSQC
jgi:hypothetical protein